MLPLNIPSINQLTFITGNIRIIFKEGEGITPNVRMFDNTLNGIHHSPRTERFDIRFFAL